MLMRECMHIYIYMDKIAVMRYTEWSEARLGQGDRGEAGDGFGGEGWVGGEESLVDPWSGVTDSRASW